MGLSPGRPSWVPDGACYGSCADCAGPTSAECMPRWRIGCFLIGFAAIYVVLLTRFEYLAQHMFFLNRVQHAVMHHFGPFLIALSWPGATIARGMPGLPRRWCESGPVRRVLRGLQQPVLAVLLFEGLLVLWLVPPVMFRAMFDWRLYEVMNASMVVDGLLFWFLVLDPRPNPPARDRLLQQSDAGLPDHFSADRGRHPYRPCATRAVSEFLDLRTRLFGHQPVAGPTDRRPCAVGSGRHDERARHHCDHAAAFPA